MKDWYHDSHIYQRNGTQTCEGASRAYVSDATVRASVIPSTKVQNCFPRPTGAWCNYVLSIIDHLTRVALLIPVTNEAVEVIIIIIIVTFIIINLVLSCPYLLFSDLTFLFCVWTLPLSETIRLLLLLDALKNKSDMREVQNMYRAQYDELLTRAAIGQEASSNSDHH